MKSFLVPSYKLSHNPGMNLSELNKLNDYGCPGPAPA